MYIKLTWIFLIAAIGYYLLNELIFNVRLLKYTERGMAIPIHWKIAFCFFAIVLHLMKHLLFRKGLLEKRIPYYLNRLVWIFIISFAIVFINAGIWIFIFILFSILVTSLSKGPAPGLVLTASSFLIHASVFFLAGLYRLRSLELLHLSGLEYFLIVLFMHFIFALFSIFCGMIFRDNTENEKENKHLMEQLKEKYLQLEMAQEEIKRQYEKLKGTNSKLEEMNLKLSASIAEFYTLQQISQAISSILDIGELLKYLNDIIIGVMGVNYSTIILADEKTGRLKVQVTNIAKLADIITLSDNINNNVLTRVVENGEHFLVNYVDRNLYPFTRGREVNSLICVPLNTKSRKFGLVLVEHKLSNAFDDDNVRLLDIISQQVGIAMENADLYQKMQELATRDGLTGIYNRQYFQQRLESEFHKAQKGDYPLSAAIFDIDHFKKFNDTFGHLFGDKVLKSITDAVSGSLRKNDIFARFGGEEFILLFPGTNLKEAYEKVEVLRRMIGQHIIRDSLVTVSVTASFGVSSFNECALSENELLRSADDALFEAKASGRNCIRVAGKLLE